MKLGTRNCLVPLLVCGVVITLVLLVGVCLHRSHDSCAYEDYAMLIARGSQWKDATFRVWSAKQQGFVQLHGKRRDGAEGLSQAAVFFTEGGHLWAGPVLQFYIETGSGILGGKVNAFRRNVSLYESKLADDRFKNRHIDEVLDCFEKEFCVIRSRSPGKWVIQVRCFAEETKDRSVSLPMEYLYYFYYELAETPDAIQVNKNILRLELVSFLVPRPPCGSI